MSVTPPTPTGGSHIVIPSFEYVTARVALRMSRAILASKAHTVHLNLEEQAVLDLVTAAIGDET